MYDLTCACTLDEYVLSVFIRCERAPSRRTGRHRSYYYTLSLFMPTKPGASQVMSALAYFNHVRVPAALIAGLSVAGLFVAIPQGGLGRRTHQVLCVVYVSLLAFAVVLHLICCFVSTAAGL